MKYGAQVFDLDIPVHPGMTSDELCDAFELAYELRYGKSSGYAPAGIEGIRLRVRAIGRLPKPRLGPDPAAKVAPAAPTSDRQVWWRDAGGFVETPVYQLSAGRLEDTVAGPAVIELPDTTLPVRPGDSVRQDEVGNLILKCAPRDVGASAKSRGAKLDLSMKG
jgi:N-methylhydantoinase A